MRNAARMTLVLAFFFGVHAAGCAWFQKNGPAVASALGCALSVAKDIAGAVHAGQQGAWFDTATAGLAGANDALGCASMVTRLVQADHSCASADGAACSSIPVAESVRLDKVQTMAEMVAKLRERNALVMPR